MVKGKNGPVAIENNEKSSLINEPVNPKFSINVLQTLKSAQMQHGLRQGDYTRYRRYCTARLGRLYKSLKLTHGRGKYTKRVISESIVTKVGYLHVVLYMAERAWSHAMEKPDTPNVKQRMYLIGRMRKAVKWASLFAQLSAAKADARTSLEAEAYASYMMGSLLFRVEKNWDTALKNFVNARVVYEELGKYGDLENQGLCRERVEEIEASIRYCLHKLGTSEILDIGKMEGPELDLFEAKLETVKNEARSQKAATEFHWLGHRLPISNAKTRVSIMKAQELEKAFTCSVPAEKKVVIFDKVIAAYHDARSTICNNLVTAGNDENAKDNLNGLDKAVSAVLGQRKIERNQLLVSIAKGKINKQKDDKVTKPEGLVRLYDFLIQDTNDLTDLVNSGRDRKPEEVAFSEEYAFKSEVFRAERCFYLAKSYSLAGKKTEAYALYSHVCSLADNTLKKLQSGSNDKVMIQELKALYENCRANICIEHASAIIQEVKSQEKLSKGVSSISLTGTEKPEKFLVDDTLDVYESAIGEPGTEGAPRIDTFSLPFQPVACDPVISDLAFKAIGFPSLENRMRKGRSFSHYIICFIVMLLLLFLLLFFGTIRPIW